MLYIYIYIYTGICMSTYIYIYVYNCGPGQGARLRTLYLEYVYHISTICVLQHRRVERGKQFGDILVVSIHG